MTTHVNADEQKPIGNILREESSFRDNSNEENAGRGILLRKRRQDAVKLRTVIDYSTNNRRLGLQDEQGQYEFGTAPNTIVKSDLSSSGSRRLGIQKSTMIDENIVDSILALDLWAVGDASMSY